MQMHPQYRTVTAAGIAGSVIVVGLWALGLAGVPRPPDEVTEALTVLVTSGLAWLVHPKVKEDGDGRAQ